jgi:2-phospho-L-lactate guanylyltransferase (CobY/MobA/RfbA family)
MERIERLINAILRFFDREENPELEERLLAAAQTRLQEILPLNSRRNMELRALMHVAGILHLSEASAEMLLASLGEKEFSIVPSDLELLIRVRLAK